MIKFYSVKRLLVLFSVFLLNVAGVSGIIAAGLTGQTISFVNVSKIYGDDDFSPATANSGLPVYYSSSNVSVAIIVDGGTKIKIVGVGTSSITASQPGNGSFSAAPNITKTLTVNKATITARPDDCSREYGDPNPVFTIAYSGFVNGEDINVLDVKPVATCAATSGSNAASYAIKASGGVDNNYKFIYNDGSLTVTKATVTATAEDKSRVYGNSNPTFTIAYIGFKNGENSSKINTKPSVTTTATSSSNVGTYPIVLNGGSSTNYNLILVNGTLTINKALLTVTPDNKNKDYGSDNPALTFKYSGFKLSQNSSVLTELPVISTTATKNSDVGAYPITLSGGSADNYTLVLNNGVLTINKKSLRVTADNKSKKYGEVNPVLTYVYSGFVLGQNNSVLIQEPVASTTAEQFSPAGTYPISLSGGSALNYSFNLVAGTLTIAKATQSINFPEISDLPFGSPDFDPATASSGLPITYFSSNPNIISVLNGKLHITGVGQVLITAYQFGNNNYQSVDVQRWITIGKSNQTVSFSGNIVKTFNDKDFNPAATASSGLPVTYSVANPEIAIPSFDGIKIIGAGVTTITATQSGNESYNAASATVTLTVEKASQSITFGALSPYEFGYPDFTPGAISNAHLAVIYSSDNPLVATIVNNMVHITGTGTARITALQPGNNNYKPAVNVVQELLVLKAPQSINFGPIQSRVYGDPDFSPGAISSAGLPVTYTSSNSSVAEIHNGKIRITGVGSTIITANQSGTSNYLAAESISQTFQVSKASQNIVFNSIPEKAIDQPVFTLTATATSGLPVSYSIDNPTVASISNGIVTIHSTGIANITASQGGNSLYLPAGNMVQKLIVKNSSQSITFGSLPEKIFGDPDFSIAATASSGLPVSFFSDNTNVAVVTNNMVKITGAGTANIFAIQAGNANYAAATPVMQTLKINKLTQSLSFPALPSKRYGAEPFYPVASSSSGLGVDFLSSNPAVALVIEGKIYITGVGSATITALQSGNNNFIAASPVSQILVVSKSLQSITFNSLPVKKYGDPEFLLNAVSSSGLPVKYTSSNAGVATIVNNRVRITGTGTCTITASEPGDDYYLPAASKMQILIVEKANQTIEFPSIANVNFGSPEFSLNASATSGLPVSFTSSNADIASITNGVVKVLRTGTVLIVASQNGNENYYPATQVSQQLVINKQSQVLVFDSISPKTYGDVDFNTGAIASSGLPVSIEIDNPQIAQMVNGKIRIVGAGTTKITARQNGNESYYASEKPVIRTLVVNKAILTVTPVKASRNYLEPDPPFYVSYSGFVKGETSSVIDIAPLVQSNASVSSYPGVYELTAKGGMDGNYDFVYQKGVLLVLGTKPLKPAKPEGNTRMCIQPGKQEYRTAGAVFASSFIWSIKPETAGQITGTGKTASIRYNDNFTGRVAIAVKAQNAQGYSETSDTLFAEILNIPEKPTVAFRGKYCSENNYGDSIRILNSQNFYQYELRRNNDVIQNIIVGNGGRIGWGNVFEGRYSISEKICNTVLIEDILISEADPSSSRPRLEVKWNDVVICRNNGDSIEEYSWYKNGELLADQKKQYLWTQKQQGYYAVKTTDITGCIFTSDSIWISSQPSGSVYPNPNNGNFRLTFSNTSTGKIIVRITTINSSVVKNFEFSKTEELFETDISLPGLKTGIYFIELIQNGERVYYEKFIRE